MLLAGCATQHLGVGVHEKGMVAGQGIISVVSSSMEQQVSDRSRVLPRA